MVDRWSDGGGGGLVVDADNAGSDGDGGKSYNSILKYFFFLVERERRTLVMIR